MKKIILILALFSGSISAAPIPENQSGVIVGIEIGQGDESVLPGSNSNLNEGDSMAIKLGYEQVLGDFLSARATIGYAGMKDSRVENRISEFPINFMGFVIIDKHKIGLGLTYHLMRDLDVHYSNSSPMHTGETVRYRAQNAIGVKTEYDYFLDNHMYIGGYFEHVQYNYKDRKSNDGWGRADQKYNGSTLGCTLGYLF